MPQWIVDHYADVDALTLDDYCRELAVPSPTRVLCRVRGVPDDQWALVSGIMGASVGGRPRRAAP